MPVMSFAQDQNMHMSVSMSGQNTMLPDSNKTADQKNSIVSSASRDSSFSGGSVIVDRLSARQRPRGFFGMIGHGIKAFFREFTNFDTTYIEPQKYNYAFLLQNTNTYEAYSFSSREGKRISFSPDMSYKLGPYFGWKWLFLGYSIDLTHLGSTSLNDNRTEYDLSLYSNMLGLDLFWRETGNNYKVRSVDLGNGINTHDIKNSDFQVFIPQSVVSADITSSTTVISLILRLIRSLLSSAAVLARCWPASDIPIRKYLSTGSRCVSSLPQR